MGICLCRMILIKLSYSHEMLRIVINLNQFIISFIEKIALVVETLPMRITIKVFCF